jgi:hypothetical protein
MPRLKNKAMGLWLLAVLAAAGCSGGEAPQIGVTTSGLRCVDDTPHCISQRQATLKSLIADPSRSWAKQPPDAAAYASGVRLFAFKTKKKELSCAELKAARIEADGAGASLRASGNKLSPAQISRGIMLAGEVGRELGSEFSRRCKKA